MDGSPDSPWSSSFLFFFFCTELMSVFQPPDSLRSKRFQHLPHPSPLLLESHKPHRLNCQVSTHLRSNLKQAQPSLFFSGQTFQHCTKQYEHLGDVWSSARINTERLNINILDNSRLEDGYSKSI